MSQATLTTCQENENISLTSLLIVQLADLISVTKNAILTRIPLSFFQPKWRVHYYIIYASNRACHTSHNPCWRAYLAVILFSRSKGLGSALRL